MEIACQQVEFAAIESSSQGYGKYLAFDVDWGTNLRRVRTKNQIAQEKSLQ